ncbi:MAG: TraG family conjugative transposon ATPase [Bacteroidota bacterium]
MSRFKKFELDYIGIEPLEHAVVYHKMGDYSVILSIRNGVEKLCADSSEYYRFQQVFANIIKTLGAGYSIQKHDVFAQKVFNKEAPTDDFLDREYFNHFKGRVYNDVTTYLTITKNVTRSTFFQYDAKEFATFLKNISKVIDILDKNEFYPESLTEPQIKELISRFTCMNFSESNFSLSNFDIGEERIRMGENVMESVSLINIDEVDLPNAVKPYKMENVGYDIPKDIMSFLHTVPETKTLVYHQFIQIPNQKKEQLKLEAKKKKHSSMPDPANDVAVKDIELVFNLIAKENELLVYAHYNIMLFGEPSSVFKAKNYVENELFGIGIIPSKNSYNQKELFMGAFPGHSNTIKGYDKFLTTSDPSIALCYKESIQKDEESHSLIHLTDRSGIPIAIDLSEMPRATGRISNMNKFVLGPSGTGKSFTTNTICRQVMGQGAEIIMVDTGHSYRPLCNYLNGKYITYTEEKPITINPFKFNKTEYNTEKKEYIKTLIGVLWKGAEGKLTQLEDSLLLEIITCYFNEIFVEGNASVDASFNGFYIYSIEKMKEISKKDKIEVPVKDYAYVLKKWYKGGEYETILNSDMDKSLFEEKFIVFEIDNIKDNKALFPVITLVIMDVFLQKMRHRTGRKELWIEEAWKALTSKMMAEYILYVYKTVRKFNGSANLVTQSLDDILDNPIVKEAIIDNSDTIVLLDQSKFKDNYDRIANLLGINEIERRKIFTINQLDNRTGRSPFKECYIKRGNRGEVYGIEESIYGYLTYTTESKEKKLVAKYVHATGSHEAGLKRLVADWKSSGLSKERFVQKMIPNDSKVLESTEDPKVLESAEEMINT